MIKTEDRLSRNLDDEDFTERINEEICRLGAAKVKDEMVIAIAPGDIRKKYARKMEFLGKVYDGSENEVGEGYHLCKIVAADIESKQVIPLYCKAYSHKAEEVKSENSELWKVVEYYLARWKCDESYRYIKHCYNLENVRVKSYIGIRNIVVLVLAVSYFAAVYLGDNIKLRLLVERVFLVSERFFGVPSFF